MVAIKKLLSYIIPLVVLVLFLLFYYNPTGAFESVKDVVSDVTESIDDLIGAEEVTASRPTLPPAQQAEVDKLISTMERMKSSTTKFCFDNYGGFSSLGGTTITLTYNEQKKSTAIEVLRGVGGVQEVFYKEIEGVKPCVIAGSEDVVDKFYDVFFGEWNYGVVRPLERKKVYLENPALGQYFMPVKQIMITFDSFQGMMEGNIIRIPVLPSNIINEYENFNDNGFLYKPDNEHICFFPTGDNDEDGLDEDYFSNNGDEFSIPQQLKTGKINSCS